MNLSRCSPVLINIFALVILSVPGNAEVPNTIKYQGRLTDADDQPLTGPKLIKFSIYGSPAGGDALWTSNYQVIQVNDGVFSYDLGSNEPLSQDLFLGGEPRYLGITIDTDLEAVPRAQFISVPFALHSLVADSVSGTGYVQNTGDTITGNLYFDTGSPGKEAELILYSGQSIMNFYESGAKRITLESEFGTIVLRGQDGDLSMWLSGGEEPGEGGSIRLYDSAGSSQIYLDGDRIGDNSVVLTPGSINASEILNEAGIANYAITGGLEITTTTMVDLITVSVTVPAAGYIHLTGKAVIQRTVPGPADECFCAAYLQIDLTAGGSWSLPHFSKIGSWVKTTEEGTLNAERTYFVDAAGTYTYRLEASREATGEGCTIWIYNPELTAMYYPTSYEASR